MAGESQTSPPSDDVRRRMSSQRRADTVPELALRRELHRRGLRFRVGLKVPGRPRRTIDIAFPKQRVAIFVDGCFWHRCPQHSVPAKNNSEWWSAKLTANVERDRQTTQLLVEQGWQVFRVWEHEDPAAVADGIEELVRGERHAEPESV